MDTTYHHQPLTGANSTRLFNLVPSFSSSDPIEIQLFEIGLASVPKYEALSYTWGDVNQKVAINCDKKELRVTSNCESALRHLRLQSRKRTLWVDAICIDQTSNDERNQQVRIMGDIYSTASLVQIWLGPAMPMVDVAFAFLAEFKSVMSMDQKSQDGFAKAKYQMLRETQEFFGDKLNVFADIFQRSWFQRVWTLQELALSRDALVVCGKSTIPWDVLVYAVDRLRAMENTIGVYDYLSAFDSVLFGHQVFVQIVSEKPNILKYLNHNSDLPITTVIATALRKRATDHKDYVFALHSVLQRLGASLPEPDYGRADEQIFVEAARLAIERDNSLWILDFVNGLEERQKWPSWVPTWVETLVPAIVEAGAFMAAGNSQPQYKFSNDGRRLTIRAKVIDAIMLKANRSPFLGIRYQIESKEMTISDAQEIENVIKAYQDWMEQFGISQMFMGNNNNNRYGDRSKRSEAFVLALLQNLTIIPESLSNIKEIMAGFQSWQRYLSATRPFSMLPMPQLEAMLKPHSKNPAWLPKSLHHLTETNEWKIFQAISQDPKAAMFDMNFKLGNRAKTFFMTKGGYYGTAPASIKHGDAVILVSGLQMPLIVRPVEEGSTFKLLGPAYVQGMMGGELWADTEKDLADLTII